MTPVILVLLALLVAVSLGWPEGAYAQQISDLPTIEQLQAASDTTPMDASKKILSGLLGVDRVASPFAEGGAPQTPLQKIMFIFNGLLFVLGGGYLGWRMLETVTRTATSGEMSWGSDKGGWREPIRLTLGIFGLVPIFSGFSLAQATLIWALSLGIGGANLAQEAMVDAVTSAQFLPEPAPTAEGATAPSTIAQAASAATIFAVCQGWREENDAMILGAAAAPSAPNLSPRTTENTGFAGTRQIVAWPGCGTLEMPGAGNQKAEESVISSGHDYAAMAYRAVAARAQAAVQSAQNQIAQGVPAIVRAHWHEIGRWGLENGTRAPEAVAASLRDDIARFAALTQTELRKNLTAALPPDGSAARAAAQARLTESGWMQTPLIYQIRAEAEGVQLAALNAYQVSVHPDPDLAVFTQKFQIGPYLAESLLNQAQAADVGDGGGWCPESLKTSSGNCSLGQAILRGVVDMAATDGQGRVDPLLAAKKIGDATMVLGQGALGVSAFPTSLLPGGFLAKKVMSFAVGDLLEKFQNGLAPIGWALLLAGMLLSLYIPLIPLITWASAVISWLFSVLEALLQSGVSLLAHFSPPGGGEQIFSGASAKVYLAALNLVLRPIVMVLGFFAACSALPYIGGWLLPLFFAVIGQVQGDSLTGLASIVGFIGILGVTLFGLVQTVFSLVLIELPNRLLVNLGGESSTPTAAISAAAAAGALTSAAGHAPSTAGIRSALGKSGGGDAPARVPGGRPPAPPAAPQTTPAK